MKSSLFFSFVLLSAGSSLAAVNAPLEAKPALSALDRAESADSDDDITEQNRLELKHFLQQLVADKPSEVNRSPAVLGPAVDESGKAVLITSDEEEE
ncbi:hypothetical protein WDW86_09585 [Bdellovibrionota bacterium FG-2]